MTEQSSSPDLIIRTPVAADVEAIGGIHVRAWQAAYRHIFDGAYLDALDPAQRVPMWQRMVERDDVEESVWVVEQGGQVIGFCSIGDPRDDTNPVETGELYTLYLDPDETGRGLGHALITYAEQAMRAHGKAEAILYVLRDNTRARRFYEAHGWQADGEEKLREMWGVPIIEVRYWKALIA